MQNNDGKINLGGILGLVFIVLLIAAVGGYSYQKYQNEKQDRYELVGICENFEEIEDRIGRMIEVANGNRGAMIREVGGLNPNELGLFTYELVTSQEMGRHTNSVGCLATFKLRNRTLWGRDVYVPLQLLFKHGYFDDDERPFVYAVDMDDIESKGAAEMVSILGALVDY